MSIAPPAPAPPRTTPRGTPCAASWGDAWVAQIDAREQALGRRICGARTVGGTPCPLPSDHASGRCRHHGGFALTGAPADNRNAVVHGLYSRRLMICGSHCPAWQSCPMGGGSAFRAEDDDALPPDATDAQFRAASRGGGTVIVRHADGSMEQHINGITIYNPPPGTVDENGEPINTDETSPSDAPTLSSPRKRGPLDSPQPTIAAKNSTPPKRPPETYAQSLLKLPLSERPLCPYEQTEYNAVVTDLMKRTQANAGNAMGLHLAHQIALLTVMVSRAARALAVAPLTEKFEQSAQNYHMSLERPSAALTAFEKLSRELRRWMHLIEREYHTLSADHATTREHELRRKTDTIHDPDGLATLDQTGALAQKENTQHTAAREAHLDQIDRAIVDTLFARFNVKPQAANTEAQRNTEKIENNNKPKEEIWAGSPQTEDG